jgi:hypothetical protein
MRLKAHIGVVMDIVVWLRSLGLDDRCDNGPRVRTLLQVLADTPFSVHMVRSRGNQRRSTNTLNTRPYFLSAVDVV